jgi:hypothetical protein
MCCARAARELERRGRSAIRALATQHDDSAQLFCAPAADHALKSVTACAFDGPLGGMLPPNHDRHELLALTNVTGDPVM